MKNSKVIRRDLIKKRALYKLFINLVIDLGFDLDLPACKDFHYFVSYFNDETLMHTYFDKKLQEYISVRVVVTSSFPSCDRLALIVEDSLTEKCYIYYNKSGCFEFSNLIETNL